MKYLSSLIIVFLFIAIGAEPAFASDSFHWRTTVDKPFHCTPIIDGVKQGVNISGESELPLSNGLEIELVSQNFWTKRVYDKINLEPTTKGEHLFRVTLYSKQDQDVDFHICVNGYGHNFGYLKIKPF